MSSTPAETNRKITEIFRFRSLRDNLPLSAHRGTRDNLGDVYRELGFTRGVEVGVRAAEYSKTILEKVPGVNLICVDPWAAYSRLRQDTQDRYYDAAVAVLKNYPNARILRLPSMEAVKQFEDGSLDFVFIDGNHEFDYAAPDTIFWAYKVRSGGIVAVHDYYNFYMAGVVKAVDGYTHCHRINPWYVTRETNPTAFWVKP